MALSLDQLVTAAYDAEAPLSGAVVLAVPVLRAVLDPLIADVEPALQSTATEEILQSFWTTQEDAEDAAQRVPFSRLDYAQRALLVSRFILAGATQKVDEDGPYTNLTARRQEQLRLPGWQGDDHTQLIRRSAWQFGRCFEVALKEHVETLVDERASLEKAWSERANLLADRLDEATSYYPEHLTQSALAEQLTVSVIRAPQDAVHHGASLFGAEPTHDGEPARDVLPQHRRVVLLGDPGSAKSTVLKAAVIEQLRTTHHPAVFASLAEVARALKDRPAGTMEEAIEVVIGVCFARVGGVGADDRARFASRLRHDEQALIALDGLDEVRPGDDLEGVLDLVRALGRISGRLVISSRFVGYIAPPGEWAHLSTDRLAPEARERIVGIWFGDGNPEAHRRTLAALERDRSREGIAGIPVLLGFIADAARAGEVPRSEGALYEGYLARFLQRVWKPVSAHRQEVPAIRQLTRVARTAAWQIATSGTAQADTASWADVVTYERLLDLTDEADHAHIDTLVRRDGLFIRHGSAETLPQQELRWIHRTVQEHLVGTYLAALPADEFDQHFDFIADAAQAPSQWLVPLTHMIDALPADRQESVLSYLLELRGTGDPGDVILDTLEGLVMATDRSLLANHAIFDHLLDAQRWIPALRLKPELAQQRLLHQAERGTLDLSRRNVWFGLLDTDSRHRLIDALLALESSLDQQRWLGEMVASVIRESVRDGAAALTHAINNGLEDTSALGECAEQLRELQPAERARLVEAVARMQQSIDRVTMLILLLDADIGLDPHVAPDGPLNPNEASLAIELRTGKLEHPYARENVSELHVPAHVVQDGLRGVHGRAVAFALGKHSYLQHRGDEVSPWAVIGWLETNFYRELYLDARQEGLAASLPTIERAVEIASSFSLDAVTQPDDIIDLYFALGTYYREITDPAIDATPLVNVFRVARAVREEVARDIGRVEPALLLWPLMWMLPRLSPGKRIGLILESQQSDWTPDDYRDMVSWDSPLLGGGTYEEVSSWVSSLIRWAAQGRLPAFALFDNSMVRADNRTLDAIVYDSDLLDHASPEDVAVLARWLAARGLLANYRPAILTFAARPSAEPPPSATKHDRRNWLSLFDLRRLSPDRR